MQLFGSALAASALLAGLSSASVITKSLADEGSIAFSYPAGRSSSDATDLSFKPCGTKNAVGDRSKFPLTGAQLSLLVQEYGAAIANVNIAYGDAIDDASLKTMIDGSALGNVNPGTLCLPFPDASSDVKAGSDATIQIKYSPLQSNGLVNTAVVDYVCADITFVNTADYSAAATCVNSTSPSSGPARARLEVRKKGGKGGSSGGKKKKTKLKGGVIAGIVIAIVVVILLLCLFLWLARKRKANKNGQISTAPVPEPNGYQMNSYPNDGQGQQYGQTTGPTYGNAGYGQHP